MRRGEIWEINLPAPPGGAGREQAGARPALAVQNDPDEPANPMCLAIPFTSNPAALRFPHTLPLELSQANGLTRTSVLLVFQLRALDKQRFIRRLGDLEQSSLESVEKYLKVLLGV